MNDIRAWSIAICLATLGCAAMRLLAPKVGSGKLFSLITSSFFLCALVVPLLKIVSVPNLDVEWLPPDIVAEQLDDRVTKQLTVQIEKAVSTVVEEAMAARNIEPKNVEVVTDISWSGGIYMKQITVYVDKQNVPIALTVREVLEQQLETTVVIEAEG